MGRRGKRYLSAAWTPSNSSSRPTDVTHLTSRSSIIRTVGQAFDRAQAVGRRAVPRARHQLRMAVAPRAAVTRAVDDADIQIEQGEVHPDARLPETVDESLELPVGSGLPVTFLV
jgi:hypothetical protein